MYKTFNIDNHRANNSRKGSIRFIVPMGPVDLIIVRKPRAVNLSPDKILAGKDGNQVLNEGRPQKRKV